MDGIAQMYHTDPGAVLAWDPPRLALAIQCRNRRLEQISEAVGRGVKPQPVVPWMGIS